MDIKISVASSIKNIEEGLKCLNCIMGFLDIREQPFLPNKKDYTIIKYDYLYYIKRKSKE